MICPKCGKKLIQGKSFCGYCGNKIEITNVASTTVQEIYPTERPKVTPEVRPNVISEIEPEVIPNIDSEPTYGVPVREKKGFSPFFIVGPLLLLLVIACTITAFIMVKNSTAASQAANVAANAKKTDTKPAATVKDATPSQEATQSQAASSNTSPDTTTKSSSTVVTNASDYFFSSSDKAYLVEADLKVISKDQLAIARNEIYARHGFVFTTQPFLDYFNSKTWYTPNPAYKGGDETLNKFEIANIKLIKKLEAGDTIKITSDAAALKILQAKVKVDSHIKFIPMKTNSFWASYYGFSQTYIRADGTKEEGDMGSAIFVEKKTGDIYVLDVDKDSSGKTLKKY